VVIHEVLAAVDVCKERDILLLAFFFHVKEICRDKIERGCIEVNKRFKLLRADTIVAELG
jgi:hypothetical protein